MKGENDKKPTHYNQSFQEAKHLNFTEAEFKEMNDHYQKQIASIKDAEAAGTFVLTSKSREFP